MRHEFPLLDGWRFTNNNPADAESLLFDDSKWRRVQLPHDWSIEEPYDSRWASATAYLPGGVGWYRRELDLTKFGANQRFSIYFDGIYRGSDVWINGRHIGNRPNGFVSFEYDITDYIFRNGLNVVAVRVDHSEFADSRWYTGSGINRSVKLIVREQIHIPTWGVEVTTANVSESRATVDVAVDVINCGKFDSDVELRVALFDRSGEAIGADSADCTILAGQFDSNELHINVESTSLWSVDNPYLYLLTVSVVVGESIQDCVAVPVGIRSIRFDTNEGFFLNGVSLKLKGVCVHDDAGVLGTAVPTKVWERRLQTLKDAGVNAIRMSHNPHCEEVYDLCDRMGILVQDEAFDEWEGAKNKWISGWNVGTPGRNGYSKDFAKWSDNDVRDMVLRGRNHPSIIMWSIGNEIDYPNDPYSHPVLDQGTNPQSYGFGYKRDNPNASRLGEIGRELAASVREIDTTRPVTAGLAAALISNEVGLGEALDVVGYNYQEYRYGQDHERFPDRVLYGSENGMKWEFWQAVSDNPRICGQFLWTGIDYLGEAHGWPKRSNGAGLLDLAGLPKPEYYYRQSIWSGEPMVYIGTADVPTGDEASNLWSHKTAEPVWQDNGGKLIRVVCFTNCDRVELYVNGASQGEKRTVDFADRSVFWDVEFEEGTVEAIGRQGDSEPVRAFLTSTGEASALMVSALDTSILADSRDIAHVVVHVVDNLGQPVHSADCRVHVELSGPGRLLGLENGNHEDHELKASPSKRAYRGRLMAYVQSTGEPGEIELTVSSDGLTADTVRIQAS